MHANALPCSALAVTQNVLTHIREEEEEFLPRFLAMAPDPEYLAALGMQFHEATAAVPTRQVTHIMPMRVDVDSFLPACLPLPDDAS